MKPMQEYGWLLSYSVYTNLLAVSFIAIELSLFYFRKGYEMVEEKLYEGGIIFEPDPLLSSLILECIPSEYLLMEVSILSLF